MIRSIILPFLAVAAAGQLGAHTLTSIGPVAPSPGVNDISQLATGNTTWPDGLNYFTDNNPIAGQTFTTGSSPMNLVSLSVKTAGLNSGNGYGTPASTPTYYLRIYAINGNTATHLITFSSPNPGFTDGDWLKWTGMKVPLEANKTYAFSFGTKPGSGGWAALAVAANAYAGGEIAMIPINGGAITTGASHSFDAAFALGLEAFPPVIPASMPLPTPTYGFNLGNTFEATWGYPPPTQAVLISAANAGFNAVRMPCAWDFNADDTTWQINPVYMAEVKQSVDWAIAAGLHVMLNIHWDGGWMENNIGATVDPVINAKMQSYWTQIATTFAGYDNRLLFAAANEPNVHNLAEMNTLMAYYQTFINTVRGLGGYNANRWLVLQGGGDTAWFTTLPPDPTPGRLMVEYHCYSPSQFAILSEDASWGIAKYFWGPAYHYAGDPTRNCVAPEEGAIDSGFQQLKEQYVDKGIPVLIGEFGVAGKPTTGEAAEYSRASSLYWLKYVVDSAHAHGLSPFNWSTPSSLFEYATGAITNPDAVSVLTGGVAPPPPNGAPYAASGLTATTAGTGQVNLSWTAGSGATSYNLYRAAESGYESDNAPVVTGITGTSYTDTGLNDGTTYYYQLVAINASGPSGFSPEAHAMTPGVNPDPTQYHFETDTQRWSASGAQISGIATSNTRAFAGSRSLAVNFNGATGGTSSVDVSDVAVPAGETVTFRVWIPGGSPVTTLEPYVQDYNWAWNQSWYGSLTTNAWNTIHVTVPPTATTPLKRLGLRITTSAAWTGTVYMDSVNWNTLSEPAAPTGLTAAAGSGKVTLNWSTTATASSYNIKRSPTSGSGYTTIGTSVTPTYIDNGVINGTTYYYVVSAANAAGEGNNSAEASAMPTEMRAHYTFEGNAQDSSGNAFHGTPTALTYAAGPIGSQAGQFNGTSSNASIPRSVTDDFTVAMWVKTTDYGGWPGAQWWAGKGLMDGEVGGGGADWGTALVDGKFVLGVGSTSGDTTLTSSLNINNGVWHHVAATRNNTTGAMEVYVDGVLRGSGTGPTGSRTLPPGLRIGSLQTGSNFLNGTLDDVRLYDRVLTGSEIEALAGAGQSPPPAPTGISATQTAAGQATLTWVASEGAASYNVKRSVTSGGPYTTIATDIAGTSYLDSGLSVGSHYYVVSGSNLGGEGENSAEAGVTIQNYITMTLTSVASHDGYLRAASNTNTAGGTTYPTTTPSRLGDDSSNRAYKALLSFDTSSIPEESTIISGTLRFRRSGLTGTNPFTTHGTCYADIKGGTGFNGSTSLESADFQAVADAIQVAAMSNPAADGDWSSGSLNPTGLSLIDKTAATRFRLYFSTATNGNNGNDYISWFTGDDASGSNHPVLEITYTVPAPAISSATTASGTNGSPFSYQITASNSPTSFDASGLPAGLTVNTSTGLIDGTPTVTGTFNSNISATNAGGSGNATLTITIQTQAPTAPTGLVATGGNASIALVWNASAGATGYTVLRSDSNGGAYVPLVGGTTAATSYTDTLLANGATYYYVVRATNPGGQSPDSSETNATTHTDREIWRFNNFGTTGNSGTAADNADPDGDGWTNTQEYISGTDPNNSSGLLKITRMQVDGNNMIIGFPSVLGRTYRVEQSGTLHGGSWATVQDAIPGTGGLVHVTDPDGAGQGKRFYRISVAW